MLLEETFKKVKRASKSLALLSDQQRNEMLLAVADAIIDQQDRILAANAADLAKMDQKNPLYDQDTSPRRRRCPTDCACTVSACPSASSA